MKTGAIEDVLPLSPLQQGILFQTLYAPDAGMYVEQLSLTLNAAIALESFQRAWQMVLERHAALRTSFFWEDVEHPVQVVQRRLRLPLHQEDWSGMDAVGQIARLQAFLENERRQGFDLATAPLARVSVITLGPGCCQLIVSFHHIIVDGWSLALVLEEVSAYYQADCEGRDLELPASTPYGRYIAWLQQQDEAAAETYWRRVLAGYAGAPRLWVDRIGGRLTEQDQVSREQRITIAEETTARLRALARQHQLTLNTLVQGAWAVLLSRYLGVDDVVFGATVSGRPAVLEGVESMVGLFINTMPVRVRVSRDAALIPWLRELQAAQLDARQYDYSPLVKIQSWSEAPRGVPLFQTLLAFENFPQARHSASKDASRVLGKVEFFEGNDYPLSVTVDPGDAMGVKVAYVERRFDPATISGLLAHVRTLLEAMAASPDRRLGELPLLTAAEKRQLTEDWNRTAADYPQAVRIHELFDAQASRTPDALAVIGSGRQLTYRDLRQRSNQVARHLQKRGIGPETLVAICLDRSPDLIIGILGILKAGGAYLPIDPSHPKARLELILSDAQPRAVLTSSHLSTLLPGQRTTVCLDREADAIGLEPSADPPSEGTAANPAYVIYTSGSTGSPKGVVIEHRALVNHGLAVAEAYHLSPADRVLQFAPIAFDVFAEELFPALLRGAAVVLRPDAVASSFTELRDCIASHAISVLNLPASYWQEWVSDLAHSGARPPACVRLVIVGNERVLPERWNEFRALAGNGIELRNAYGPTEGTITATLYAPTGDLDATSGASVPIGRPVANVQIYILDDALEPVPIGVPGEICLSGAGLARGYLGQPALTAARFVSNPFRAGSRLYKTGDVGRYLADGSIEFLGRSDNQVKIRGHRVELEEVESALRAHAAVQDCAVAALDDESGRARLIAYVVSRRGEPELWPSIGEYFLYDPVMYHAMTHDERRNRAYRVAIARQVKDKVVLDIGTGADAILARICIEAGARRVYAVEKLDASYAHATSLIARLGLEDRIVVLHGEATGMELPEQVDVCVSELLGMIGSSEGVIPILNDARRFLKDGGVMIPSRCTTRIAAVSLPGDLATRPRFTELSGPYVHRIFEAVGHPLDVRVCIRNFPLENVVSDAQIFEDLDFSRTIDTELRSEIVMTITSDARVDGFLLWLNLWTVDGELIDVLQDDYVWLPVFFPAFTPGLDVAAGDVIRAVCLVGPSDCDATPDYRIEGTVIRKTGQTVRFDYRSFHSRPGFRQSGFHQALFGDGWDSNYAPLVQLAPVFRAFLRDRLPEYEVPSSFVMLKTLPTLSDGKIERRRLAALDPQAAAQVRFEPPRTDVEKTLAALWAEVLGVEPVGRHDNFFELGGDSIISIQLVARARRLGIALTVNQLFQYQTIAELSQVADSAAVVRAEQGLVTGDVPLTPIQRWFFEQDFVHPSHSNQAVLLEVRQPLDAGIVSEAVRAVSAHHDALRLRFVRTEGGWRQFHGPVQDPPFALIDLGAVPESVRSRAIERAAAAIQMQLDIGRGPMFRVALFDLGPHASGRLLFVFHHLVFDGVSWRILLDDFWTAYAQLSQAGPVQLPPKTMSFQSWAYQLTEYARSSALQQEAEYWLRASGTRTSPLPLDDPSGQNTLASARTVLVPLGEDETSALLQQVPKAYQTQINDVLLTAVLQAFAHWTGHPSLLIDLEGHGREELVDGIDLSRTVGWFTAVFPVRLDLAGVTHPGEALKSIKEQLRLIPKRGIGYGLLRYLGADPGVSAQIERLPRADVSFNYLGRFGPALPADSPITSAPEPCGPLSSLEERRSTLVAIDGGISEGCLQFAWTYSENIHRRSTIERLAGDFISALRSLIEHCQAPEAGGYTPSDFSRARLSQEDLDRFVKTLGGSVGSAKR